MSPILLAAFREALNLRRKPCLEVQQEGKAALLCHLHRQQLPQLLSYPELPRRALRLGRERFLEPLSFRRCGYTLAEHLKKTSLQRKRTLRRATVLKMRCELCIVVVCAIGLASAQKQTQEDPCQNKARVVGDATYCDRYWECVGGQPELYDCPNGLVFAGKHRGVTEGCDYPWRSNYCEGKSQANPPIGTDHCDWLYGIFGHETSCTRYWTCWNGTATEQLCIGGLLYNERAHSCDWPENVDGCQKHPLCNEDANGNVPLGKSCNRYWQCQGGYPRLQRCPAMLVFDRRSLRCVVPPTEDCDIPTTPPPPPEEDEPKQGPRERHHHQQQQQQQQHQDYPNLPQGALPFQQQQQQQKANRARNN